MDKTTLEGVAGGAHIPTHKQKQWITHFATTRTQTGKLTSQQRLHVQSLKVAPNILHHIYLKTQK